MPTDFDAAIAFWTKGIGVGPFYLWEHIGLDRLVHQDEAVSADFSVAVGYWGDMQIELIRQDDDAPTIYRDWNSDALHHIMIDTDDYAGALAVCEREGFPVAMHGQGLLA